MPKPTKPQPKAKGGATSSKKAQAPAKSAESKIAKPVNPEIKEAADSPKRKLGLRGAAPWAARHAAKHAAEARARASEPAPPGSARATIRVPTGAEEIKAKIAELYNQTQRIRTLRKRFDKTFYEIGQVLALIQQQELWQAKGFGSFENFLEREIDLGKQQSLRLIRFTQIFQQEAALDYGVDKLTAALAAIDGEVIPKPAPSAPGSRPPTLPLKPPMRIVG